MDTKPIRRLLSCSTQWKQHHFKHTVLLHINNSALIAVSGTLPDTPWTNVQLRSGYSGTVSYRIKSGIVFIQLDNVTGVSAMGASNWFVQLPSELAPTVYVRKTAAYGSDGAVLLTVNPTGQIYLSANFGYSLSASKNITVNFEI